MDDFPSEIFANTSSISRARTIMDANTAESAASVSDIISNPRAIMVAATTFSPCSTDSRPATSKAADTIDSTESSTEGISSPRAGTAVVAETKSWSGSSGPATNTVTKTIKSTTSASGGMSSSRTDMIMIADASSSKLSSGLAASMATDSFKLSSTITDTAIDFKARLEDLPLELYDIIKDLAFGACSVPIDCNLDYPTHRAQHVRHLKLLQLDRATRAQHAAAYYGPRTFTLRGTAYQKCLEGWLESMTKEHLGMIGGIKYECTTSRLTLPRVTPLAEHLFFMRIMDKISNSWGSEVAGKVQLKVVLRNSAS